MSNPTTVQRTGERELTITRLFNGPARLVFDAWTQPALLKRWWVPKSCGMSLSACEVDARPGGRYRFQFNTGGAESMAFVGQYLEAAAPSRLVWTNEESEDGAVTTVTFQDQGGQTLVVMREVYPSKEALDAVLEGMTAGMTESFGQLEELLGTQGKGS